MPHRFGARLTAMAAALLVVGLGAACVCPATSQELLDTGFQTPRQTFASFQAFLATDLPDEEYRCFSAGFRERNGLSLLSYGESRDELLASKPALRYLAEAEIIREEVWSQDVHVVDARVGGRTVRVKLLREDSFEISGSGELLADGYTPWESIVGLETTPRPTLRATVTPQAESIYGELAGATRLVVERTWRIDDLWELDDQDPPQP